jgi:ABC-2 type transport system ATP-binding protein
MSDQFAIETEDLRKQYAGGVEALRGLTLHVPRGSIFGFLGKNGAGKTTTIKVLLGMAHATGGRATVFGLDAGAQHSSVAIRRRTGFVSEEKDLYELMTVEQIIRFTASFYASWRGDLEHQYLRSFELPRDRKVKDLSRGMRTKLALLLALSRGAELLILDEPTSGLDPAMTEEVLQALVTHVARQETTVFLSSHHLPHVDQIADRIAIIDHGRIVVSGALEDLLESYRRLQLVFEGDAPDHTFRAGGVVRQQRRGRVLTAICSGGVEAIAVEAQTLGASSVEILPVVLKEIFLETVNGEN